MEQNWHSLNRATGDNHIFCIGDVHGEIASLDAALAEIDALPKHGPVQIIFLGDLIDRGPAPLECIDRAWARGDILLPGNHELMMLEAIGYHTDELRRVISQEMWIKNGGITAIQEIQKKGHTIKSEEDIFKALEAEMPDGFIETIMNRTHYRAGDLIFTHAGVHPHHDLEDFLALGPFDNDNWAWIRDPFLDHVGGWDDGQRQIIVHGHTPWEHDSGSSMEGAMSERNRAWKERETIGIDTTFADAAGADMVKDRQRINLDSGCGKFTTSLPFAEFWNGDYRLHAVTPQAIH